MFIAAESQLSQESQTNYLLETRSSLEEKHLSSIENLFRKCARPTSDIQLHPKMNWNIMRTRPNNSNVMENILVYQRGNFNLVGYLGLFTYFRGEAEICFLVDPKLQKNIRTELFRQLFRLAKLECCQRGSIKGEEIKSILFIIEQSSCVYNELVLCVKPSYLQFDHLEIKMKLNLSNFRLNYPSPTNSAFPSASIEEATPNNLHAIIDLENISFRTFMENPQYAEYYHTHHTPFSKRCFLMYVDEGDNLRKLIGKLDLVNGTPGPPNSSNHTKELYIEGLCVDPAFRKKGYATSLLVRGIWRVLEEQAKGEELKIVLDVYKENTVARRIYDRIGFEKQTAYEFWEWKKWTIEEEDT